ncbi:UNVERIFIED_CONTAM: Retrovirus-related Pol polyprotein from transposon TNT 1-94 [Sesamum radiatum]|uniref:Retrovirus-related Pol polyprotein from transposon TNT 1-94 n=1 Tax=Sesamum radiatum TaxID=300843 RepID=A0AAW2N8S3_SESRA
MDTNTTFLNCDIDETIYMMQPENFASRDPKNMLCRFKKSIYELKQTSLQWHLKFHKVIISFGFEMNLVDDCVYRKFCGSKQFFLVLYVGDILLPSNDVRHRDTPGLFSGYPRILTKELYRKSYKRYGMQDSKPGDAPMAKRDKFSLKQCPKNNFEEKEMHKIPYSSVVKSLMYAQVCTGSDIAYIITMLAKYVSNPMLDH